jgi:hypothetical protein
MDTIGTFFVLNPAFPKIPQLNHLVLYSMLQIIFQLKKLNEFLKKVPVVPC